MDTIKLSVNEREETGNGPARRLRAQGRIPAVTYGKGKEPPPSRSTWRAQGGCGPRPQRRSGAGLRQGSQGASKARPLATPWSRRSSSIPPSGRCCTSTFTRSTWPWRSRPR